MRSPAADEGSGVVDEGIDAAETLQRRVGEPATLVGLRKVHLQGGGAPAPGLNGDHDFVSLLLARVEVHGNRGAMAGELAGYCRTDPKRGSGRQSNVR